MLFAYGMLAIRLIDEVEMPTRPRALGTVLSSPWLRLGSLAGPMVVGFTMAHFGIQYVFPVFAAVW